MNSYIYGKGHRSLGMVVVLAMTIAVSATGSAIASGLRSDISCQDLPDLHKVPPELRAMASQCQDANKLDANHVKVSQSTNISGDTEGVDDIRVADVDDVDVRANGSAPAVLEANSLVDPGSLSSLLLRPRHVEIGLGISYRKEDRISNLRTQQSRDISMPLSLKVGFAKSFELSFSTPYVNRTKEWVTSNEIRTDSISGQGDSTLGILYQLVEGKAVMPDVSLSASISIPASSGFAAASPDDLSLSFGFRSVTLGLAVVKSSDPAVLFGNLSFRSVMARDIGGFVVEPGSTLSYGFGAGFSVNRHVTLTTQVSGSIQSETKFDSRTLPGTGSEPISINTGLSYQISRKRRIEGGLGYGLNQSASGVDFDLMFIQTF